MWSVTVLGDILSCPEAKIKTQYLDKNMWPTRNLSTQFNPIQKTNNTLHEGHVWSIACTFWVLQLSMFVILAWLIFTFFQTMQMQGFFFSAGDLDRIVWSFRETVFVPTNPAIKNTVFESIGTEQEVPFPLKEKIVNNFYFPKSQKCTCLLLKSNLLIFSVRGKSRRNPFQRDKE